MIKTLELPSPKRACLSDLRLSCRVDHIRELRDTLVWKIVLPNPFPFNMNVLKRQYKLVLPLSYVERKTAILCCSRNHALERTPHCSECGVFIPIRYETLNRKGYEEFEWFFAKTKKKKETKFLKMRSEVFGNTTLYMMAMLLHSEIDNQDISRDTTGCTEPFIFGFSVRRALCERLHMLGNPVRSKLTRKYAFKNDRVEIDWANAKPDHFCLRYSIERIQRIIRIADGNPMFSKFVSLDAIKRAFRSNQKLKFITAMNREWMLLDTMVDALETMLHSQIAPYLSNDLTCVVTDYLC